MSNVIQFLESMGANAEMATLTADAYQAAVEKVDAGEDVRDALSHRSPSLLHELLDARPPMLCFVVAPGGEDEPQPAPEEDEGGAGGEEEE